MIYRCNNELWVTKVVASLPAIDFFMGGFLCELFSLRRFIWCLKLRKQFHIVHGDTN